MGGSTLRIAGLFAGIGGLELGLHQAGHQTEVLCEIDAGAQRVLRHRFPDVELMSDVREMRSLPLVDVVAAGFPCTDLSQAGRTAGIRGEQSGLVEQVFRLLDGARRAPTWVLLENVPFMLQLDRGKAMRFLTHSLGERGYAWAYRVIDTRSFGLPQRRKRVILLASKTEDPRPLLFVQDQGPRLQPDPHHPSLLDKSETDVACGFYWTEGIRGLGWAANAIPTLKGGSTIGIPSPPAIWMPDGRIVTPHINDAERLQGFDDDWTLPAVENKTVRPGHRWKLVGNAVSVPVARWVGQRLAEPGVYDRVEEDVIQEGSAWPHAAWGTNGKAVRVSVSNWPVHDAYHNLADFLQHPLAPLSARAAAGFLERTRRSTLHFPPGLLDAVAAHLSALPSPA